MENIKLVVVDGNQEVTKSIKKYFEVRSDITVVQNFEDGEQAIKYLCDNKESYDVILMDLIIPKVDGLKILDTLSKNNINKKIIVLTSYNNEDMIKSVSKYNINYLMVKPFSLESLEDRIRDLYKENYFEVSNKRAKIEVEISELLHNLGIPSHIRGYQYIREGVMYMYHKNSYVSYITKDVYPEIAMKYDTTASRVERAIRHAIEISWDRGDLNLMENLFGHSIDYNRSKPTNSEFINTITDRMKLKNKVAA